MGLSCVYLRSESCFPEKKLAQADSRQSVFLVDEIMLILYQFERTWGNPNLSHFCCKTETYLRMAGIEHEIRTTLPLSAPKGKLPYIRDGKLKLADSRFIIRHLQTTYRNLDEGLSPEEAALSLAMQRLIEEHLF